jgi:group I intron endonuclease
MFALHSDVSLLCLSYMTVYALPVKPLFTLCSLSDKDVQSLRKDLSEKSGIYAIRNKITGHVYVGSAKDLYHRLREHLRGMKSNLRLQRALVKYGLEGFEYHVLALAPYELPSITDLETLYMSYFPTTILYNFTQTATSMFGYKHTIEAIAKIKARFVDPSNHPMFGKTHTSTAKALIQNANLGANNPMFGKEHSGTAKLKMSDQASVGRSVSLYDIN